MAKLKGKGTAFQLEIATVLTAVAQLTEISSSGAESETYDASTLDQSGAGKKYSQTGYTEPGEYSISGFFDPATIGTITDLLDTPADKNGAIVYTDSGPTTWTFTVAGVSLGVNVVQNDGVKFDSTMKLADLPTW